MSCSETRLERDAICCTQLTLGPMLLKSATDVSRLERYCKNVLLACLTKVRC
jgi:hypothetical protein